MADATVTSAPESKQTTAQEEFAGLRGTNTLILGAPGAGKTHSLTTAVRAGLKLAVLVTDPGGEETLLEAMEKEKLSLDNLYTKYVAPSSSSWDALLAMADMVQRYNYKGLTEIKSGIKKDDYTAYLDMLDQLVNFESDDGRTVGDVTELGPDWMLAIDSASGINAMAMALMVGSKPVSNPGEYQVAMNMEEQLIYKLCADSRCFFTLTAHVDKVMNEVMGVPLLSAAFLGQKLAPKVPRIFSDVVLAYREDTRFYWSTVAPNADLKKRTLPFDDKLDQDFGAIVEVWKARADRVHAQKEKGKEK